MKVRLDGHVRSVAVLIALGVDSEGRREVLGLDVVFSESRQSWSEFLRSLQHRGLKPVRLIISDEHEGIKAAIAAVMPSRRRRCRVHSKRNLLAHVPGAIKPEPPNYSDPSSEQTRANQFWNRPKLRRAPSHPRRNNGTNPTVVGYRWQLYWKFNILRSRIRWTRPKPMSWRLSGFPLLGRTNFTVPIRSKDQSGNQTAHGCRRRLT